MGWTADLPGGRHALSRVGREAGLELAIAVLLATPLMALQVRGPIPPGRLVSGTLSFDGRATAGDFTGTTKTVTGQFSGAPNLSGVDGAVEAPVESLKTGDRRRDKDLNKSMESNRYPTMRFELDRIAPKQSSGDSVPVTLFGTLHLHGVARRVELPGVIEFKGTTARVRSDFPLNLKDYRIGGLSKALGLLKMNENIDVHINLLFNLGGG